jgi:hypothetical protein
MIAIPPRKLFIHGTILLAILGFAFAGPFDLFEGPPCGSCEGSGGFYVPPSGEAFQVCPDCRGPRRHYTPERWIKEFLPPIVGMVWIVLTVSAVGALIWSTKMVDCRVCGSRGDVLLEVTSPGIGEYTVRERCYGCGGRGRLTAVDRWVIGQGWEGVE